MKKLVFVICIAFAFHSIGLRAQDPQFSQFYSSPLYLAPSFAGLTGQTRLNLNYRLQWPDMPGAYHTYTLSVDHAINAFNSGIGLILLKDKAGSGDLSLTNLTLQYAYYVKLSESWHVVPGLYVSYSQRSVDYQKLVWRDQISAQSTSSQTGESVPMDKVMDLDAGTSVLAFSDQYWIGTTVDHLLRPNQSFYILENGAKNYGFVPIKYSIFGGTKIINKGRLFRPYDTSLQLAFLLKKQDKFKQFDMGMYWFRKPLVLGFWYRGIPIIKPFPNQDSFSVLVGYKDDFISVGYSYDFTISRLVGATGGAHEISLTYSFKAKIPTKKMRVVPCPDF